MSELVEVTSDEQWHSHTSSLPSKTLQIIYFHTPWAAPCAQMTTVLKTLATSYPVTQPLTTSWVSLNAEEMMDVSDSFGVTAVPLLVLTRNNKMLETVSGSDATKVRAAIEKHANDLSVTATDDGGENAAAGSTGVSGNPQSGDASVPARTAAATAPTTTASTTAEPTSKEDLHARLSTLVKAAPVMLFMKGSPSTPQCGFSRQLVALLREKTVKYGFFNILADDEVRQGLKEFADWPTFPQLWVKGELVGGLDIVKEEVAGNPNYFQEFSVPPKPKATATAA